MAILFYFRFRFHEHLRCGFFVTSSRVFTSENSSGAQQPQRFSSFPPDEFAPLSSGDTHNARADTLSVANRVIGVTTDTKYGSVSHAHSQRSFRAARSEVIKYFIHSFHVFLRIGFFSPEYARFKKTSRSVRQTIAVLFLTDGLYRSVSRSLFRVIDSYVTAASLRKRVCGHLTQYII